MIQTIIDWFVVFLRFSRSYILLYSLPTNPITAIIYTCFAYYGYKKLKTRVNMDVSKLTNKILIFLSSVCLLGFINFGLENVWLTSFFIKFYFFNDGWLKQIYFNVPSGWFVNYLRNFVYMFVLYMLSHNVFKYVRFNRKFFLGMLGVSLYIVAIFFFLTPDYNYLDWTYAIMNDLPTMVIFQAFMLTVGGKPFLAYAFYSLFIPKKRRSTEEYLTLDVGCGSRPKGTVNIDRLDKDSDPLKYNLLQKHNFVVNNDKINNFVRADARYLPFQDKAFDKSYCYHLMEHISEDQKVYEELKRVSSEEIEIRVPLGIWEDLFNTVFWFKGLKPWRKKHHLRSYSKKMWMNSLVKVFDEKEISLSYGYLSFLKGLKFELDRKTRFPFPFPFELVAYIIPSKYDNRSRIWFE